MQTTIVGAGAIGCWIGAKLAASSAPVSFLARSETLSALRERGVGLTDSGATRFYPCEASDRPEDLGVQDVVVITVKSQSLPALAPKLIPLIGPSTIVVPMLNGVPWWFMGDRQALRSVDPSGSIAASIPRENIIGGVVHASASSPESGISALHFADRVILGEPGNGTTDRLVRLCDAFNSAGVNTSLSTAIRSDIWFKLWGNMTMNPMSALTLASMDRLLDDPMIRDLALSAMEEARQIGAAIGCAIDQSGAARMEVTRKLGAFKTSMLQDVEAGRSLELDALLAAPIEIAAKLGIPVPTLSALFGLTRLMARSRGLY